METISALLAPCEGNPPGTTWFLSQRASYAKFLVFSISLAWIVSWTNSWVIGDLRRSASHMTSFNEIRSKFTDIISEYKHVYEWYPQHLLENTVRRFM